jgi:23S rRNA (guanosine2251-2'-O)-methyltransferase
MKNKTSNIYSIHGINNCMSLLNSSLNINIESITVNKSIKSLQFKALNEILNNKKYNISYLDGNTFSNKYIHKHTQGIVINFSYDFYLDLFSKSDFLKNECLLMLDQINDPQNLGQIIRTSECAGINGIILPENNSVKITNTVLQVSQGAFVSTKIYMQTNLRSTIDYLKSKGFWIVGIENGVDAKQWYELDYSGKIVFILGSEGKGIRQLIKKNCDFLATIKMNGTIDSLNVSAATSVILFERQRQLSN